MKTLHSAPPPPVATSDRIPAQWAWHHRTLLRLEQKLRQTRSEHERLATERVEKTCVDPAESARDETDHEIVLAELHAEADRLTEIEAALLRLRQGTYGICEETGEPISPERLRAIPWTRYSRSAAARSEQRTRANGRF